MSKIICLDAGHGFNFKTGKGDTGAVNGNHKESVYALQITKKVGDILSKKGHKIVLTRDGDYFVSLSDRCRISDNAGANIFVSIHLNSAANKSAYGVETFHHPNSSDMSKRIAEAIQKYLVRYTKDKDRGVKTADYFVLRNTKAKAILVEVGFISHDESANKLATDDYQNKIAKAIADGIIELFG